MSIADTYILDADAGGKAEEEPQLNASDVVVSKPAVVEEERTAEDALSLASLCASACVADRGLPSDSATKVQQPPPMPVHLACSLSTDVYSPRA